MSKIIVNDIGKLPKSSAITIGVFDGVHLGHKYLIDELMKNANNDKLSPGIVTFDPHPIEILKPDIDFKYLQSLESRINRLKQTGVDFITVIKFDNLLSQLSAEDFLNELKDHLNFKLLVVGEDFRLGKNQEGNLMHLKALSQKLDFLETFLEVFQDLQQPFYT